MLAKLENGRIKFAFEKVLHIDGLIIVNPREEDYIRAGYKEVIDNRLPEREGFWQVPEYSETEENIIIDYHYEEINEEIDI